MLELEHFNYGWVTPALAYVISVIGSVLGLRCAVHGRASSRPTGWLIAAAVALGGAGIWVMHFTAMLGFSIHSVTISYDVPMTLLSAVVAIVVVWLGLSIVVRGGREIISLPLGGTITGLGVATMHYMGMFAMKSDAKVSYATVPVAASILIAVVAATAALWFMLHIRGRLTTIGAALIMGIAVCGMHYVGMAAMRAEHSGHHSATPAGVDPLELLTPLITVVTLVLAMLIMMVGVAEFDEHAVVAATPTPVPARKRNDAVASVHNPDVAEDGRLLQRQRNRK